MPRPRKHPAKDAPKVYLVEDQHNSPGKIYAVFMSLTDANSFAESLELTGIGCGVVPRTLFYGQPSVRGYNP